MKSLLLLFGILVLFTSCEKRSCACKDDIEFSWKNDNPLENIDVQVPNAVLNMGMPLTIVIHSINSIDPSLEPLEWNIQSAKLFKDDIIFVGNADLDDFVKNNTMIVFPHELFSSSNGDLIKGPLSIDLTINFPENETLLFITGTIFFYNCSDLDDNFNREECRWSSQLVGEYGLIPC